MSNKINQSQVVVIDDNEASAQTLGWAMEMIGCNANIAKSGPEAIEMVKSLEPMVVIMDIGLPDMNGFEVCKILKNIPQLKNTLFIAQTGWSEEKHRILAEEVGFNHYLLKPVNLKELQELVLAVMVVD
jgi:CheY-like chemotaxis protein